MELFVVGDIVKKNYADCNDDFLYIISEIYDIPGGNFHDGFSVSKIAKLNDNTIHDIAFDNNMTNVHIFFNYLTKISNI
jgi:hypothetical protein